MPGEEGPKDVAAALASVFAGLAEFFSMFDMSFFVSGAACLGAIAFEVSGTPELNTEKANNVIGFIVLLTACYILGLLMFMIGRTVRNLRPAIADFQHRRKKTHSPQNGAQTAEGKRELLARIPNDRFVELAESYDLQSASLPNIGKSVHYGSMYSPGWAALRQMPECQPSLRFINKYWVMAATFDGIAAAAWVWMAAVLIRNANGHWSYGDGMLRSALGVLLLISIGCLFRAKQYEIHQERELAATLAIVLPRNPAP